MKNNIEIKILNDKVKDNLPEYSKTDDAGMDLRACLGLENIMIPPGATELIPTGIAMNINDPNIAAIIIPRSGSGHKRGLVLGNMVGLIDAGYQGEIFISAWNRNYGESIKIKDLERVAQLVFVPIKRVQWDVVDEFSVRTNRGSGGFGSTGSK